MVGGNAVDCYEALDKQVALIPGETRGIGAAIATDFSDRSATVYLWACDIDEITEPDQRTARLDDFIPALKDEAFASKVP